MIPAEPLFRPGFFMVCCSVLVWETSLKGASIKMNVQPLTDETTPGEGNHEADHPTSLVVAFGADQPLHLDCGIDLAPLQIAYQTYGALNAERSNAVLVCHALTGDQHVHNVHPVTKKSGWWETLIGPGKPIDTGRYFVICANVVGGCMGTTGPASTNPATGQPWGLDFPVITLRDMVRAQAMLLDHLGIDTLFAVVGGSMPTHISISPERWITSISRRITTACWRTPSGVRRHASA